MDSGEPRKTLEARFSRLDTYVRDEKTGREFRPFVMAVVNTNSGHIVATKVLTHFPGESGNCEQRS